MLEALTAAADGGDWTSPLAGLHDRLGSAPKGALRGPFWLPMLGLLVLGSVLLALGGYGIRALLG